MGQVMLSWPYDIFYIFVGRVLCYTWSLFFPYEQREGRRGRALSDFLFFFSWLCSAYHERNSFFVLVKGRNNNILRYVKNINVDIGRIYTEFRVLSLPAHFKSFTVPP